MYHPVSVQGVDEHMMTVHYYYYLHDDDDYDDDDDDNHHHHHHHRHRHRRRRQRKSHKQLYKRFTLSVINKNRRTCPVLVYSATDISTYEHC